MSKNSRNFTKKEMQRKAVFENICTDMENKGYQRKNLIISAEKISNISILIMLPFVIAMLIIHKVGINKYEISIFRFFIFVFICLILHELIHGLVWGIYAKHRFHSINFGMIWSSLIPYCTCSEPLNKKHYIIGTLMPTIIVGFVLCGIAIFMNDFTLFIVAEYMIFGGGGDFYIVWKLLSYCDKHKEIVCVDHPYEIGLYIFEK